MQMTLRNASTGKLLARRVRRARSPWHRVIGWLLRSSIAADEGLLFEQCSAIHTIGMRSPIDVLFLDHHNRIRTFKPHVVPGQARVNCNIATKVLEMGPGFIDAHDLLIGDRLLLEPVR
jgi:uncharacterized membrane protein (UPF0127 family)